MIIASKCCHDIGRACRNIKTFAKSERITCHPPMLSVGASHAKIYHSPESGGAFEMARDLVFGLKWLALLANYDPASSCWKTLQLSLLPEVEGLGLLPTLPKWGMTRGGALYERPTLERHTNGRGGGAWPTITEHGNYNQKGMSKNSGDGLATAIKYWPTTQARDWKNPTQQNSPRIQRKLAEGWSMDLADVATWATPTSTKSVRSKAFRRGRNPNPYEQAQTEGGKLNPDWVETLMGYPIGWTLPNGPRRLGRSMPGNHRVQLGNENTARRVLKPSVTPLSRRWSTRWQ